MKKYKTKSTGENQNEGIAKNWIPKIKQRNDCDIIKGSERNRNSAKKENVAS